MTHFGQQRCFIHPSREAVSLCLECRHAFCRECVVDHDGRLVCATCLARLRATVARDNRVLRGLRTGIAGVLAVLFCWMIFYMFGRLLMMSAPEHHGFDTSEQEQQ